MALNTDVARVYVGGNKNEFPMVASDIIYAGAAIGNLLGIARPLTAGDKFYGFAEAKSDNSAGAASAINVRVNYSGIIVLSVTGAVATDVGQPVYASDDATFTFTAVGNSFVGRVHRFVSSGVVEVSFDAINAPYDEFGPTTARETKAGAYTIDALDTGKIIYVSATAVITLPVTATAGTVTLVCAGPYGTVQISADPNANDKIHGIDLAGADNKDLINTLATAQRGDFVTLQAGHADGYIVTRQRGIWAQEA